MTNPNVNYTRKELVEANKKYTIIRDCDAGEIAVKAKSTTYLPMPNASDKSDENSTRYASYKQRAVFYNVTGRTLDGLNGQIFMRNPVIEVPEQLKVVTLDADGSGVDLTQLAKKATRFTVGYGRAGLLVDYPDVAAPATVEELLKGDIRPTFTLYAPWDIINWRTEVRGARKIYTLLVLRETYMDADDGFEPREKPQWRVLSLVGNVYMVEIWRLEGTNNYKSYKKAFPKDGAGNPLTEIPFTFLGSENNDSLVDSPPMYDIASLNIAHYRNSADYEESAFMVGQPTPVFSGLSEDWVKNVLGGKVFLGSRGSVSLPVGGTAMLLQAAQNSMPYEAMQHKEKQMVALGARIVEQRNVTRTASEANIDHTTESSILASSAKNVSVAITWALGWAARFLNVNVGNTAFTLNTDFDIARMQPDARQQLILEWQAGALSWEEVRGNLRKSGIAILDDKTAKTDIDKEQAIIAAAAAKLENKNNNSNIKKPNA